MVAGIQAGDLAAPGALAALVSAIGVVLKLMLDARKDGYTLADERLEDAKSERERAFSEIATLQDRVTTLEGIIERQRVEFDAQIMEQRSVKHQTTNELMRAELLLDTVRRLAKGCTCGALVPVQALLDRREP